MFMHICVQDSIINDSQVSPVFIAHTEKFVFNKGIIDIHLKLMK